MMIYTGIADEAGTPISEQIRAHKLLGWNYVEVRNVEGGNLCNVDDATFEKTLAAVTGASMKISCFASAIANWSRFVDQDFQVDVDDLKRAIPRMKKAGCRFIRAMSWPNSKEAPLTDADWKKEAIRRMKELVKIAEDGGVVIGHENCNGWGGHSPENMREFLEEIQSPALGIIYDTGNPIAEGQNPLEMYRAAKPRLVYVHIKDGVSLEGGKHRYTYPAEGEGKIPEILADLMASGYNGFVSIEPHLASQVHLGTRAEGNTEAFNIYVEYGRRLMKAMDGVIAKGKCGCGCCGKK